MRDDNEHTLRTSRGAGKPAAIAVNFSLRTSQTLAIVGIIAVSFAVIGLPFATDAARLERTRGGETEDITPPTSPTTVTTSGNGGINVTVVGSVDSGGNSGGNVTTGDESVTVVVVNIGPTNNVPQQEEEEEEQEEESDSCGERACRPSR